MDVSLPDDLRALVSWIADGVGVLRPPEGYPGGASLVLDDGDEVVLVGAGLPPELRARLAPHVDVCLLTSCHLPYAHGAADFAQVWAPRNEARALGGDVAFLETYDVGRRDVDVVLSGIRKAGYAPAQVAKRYRAGGILRMRETEWHILAAPGVTHDMMALLEPRLHILYVGGLDPSRPPWYGWPTSDPSEVEATAERLAEVPVAHLVSAHAHARTRGLKAALRSLAESVRERDRAALAALDVPRSVDELAERQVVGGRPSTPLARYHARVMVEKHLGRLLERDYAAARQDGRYERL